MLHRGAEIDPEPYYCLPVGALHWSQPTSPAPGGTAPGVPHLFPLSPTHGMMTARHTNAPKNDEGISKQQFLFNLVQIYFILQFMGHQFH